MSGIEINSNSLVNFVISVIKLNLCCILKFVYLVNDSMITVISRVKVFSSSHSTDNLSAYNYYCLSYLHL